MGQHSDTYSRNITIWVVDGDHLKGGHTTVVFAAKSDILDCCLTVFVYNL